MVVSGAPDVSVFDWCPVGGFRHRNLVEPLLEDRFDGRVMTGLDLQRAQRSGFEPLSTKALLKPNDAKTRAVAYNFKRLAAILGAPAMIAAIQT